MDYAEVVRRRRMVRNYDPDRPVPAEVVERLLGYAVHAPSAGFSQGWEFLVLDEAGDRAAFWAATTPPELAGSSWLDGMRRAPLIVVPHSHRDAYLDRYAGVDVPVGHRPARLVAVGPALVRLGVAVEVGVPVAVRDHDHRRARHAREPVVHRAGH